MIHILHVEDDPSLQKTFARFFQRYFPEAIVTQEASAKRAIDCVKAVSFDVILSDYDLAGDCAADLVDFLKAKQPHVLDRLLILSGRSTIEGLDHKHRLVKPASNEEIAAYLNVLMNETRK